MHPHHLARTQGQKPAFIFARSGRSVSYAELDELSTRAARLFRSIGLRAGDHIALQLENVPEFLPLVIAARRAGLIYTPMATHLKAEEVAYIVRNCEARAVIFSASLAEVAHQVREGFGDERHWFMVGGTEPGFEAWEPALARQPNLPIDDEQDGMPMLYSSGTTGLPKGILPAWTPGLPPCEPSADHAALGRLFGIDGNTVYLSPAPLYHAAPLIFTTLVLLSGGSCVIMEKFDAEQSLALIERYRVTHAQFVPIMFVRMLSLPQAARVRHRMDSLRYAIHAAAPCPQDIKRRMIEWLGPVVYEYYSATEGGGLTFIDSADWLAHPGSVGRALIGRLHIVGDDGDELPPGHTGAVFFSDYRGRFEYYQEPAKTSAAYDARGWFSVGDVGHVDADGYLYLSDRRDFMIITGGVNVYPQEVENLLLSHDEVADVAVFGIPDPEFGESVKAVVQPRDWSRVGATFEQQLIAYCRERLSAVKCPRSIDFLGELPRQDNGKLYKKRLRERYLAAAG